MPSANRRFTDPQRALLLGLARNSIAYGVRTRRLLAADISGYPAELQEQGAVFVTLRSGGALRGCIGSIVAYQPLAADVIDKAHSAAFKDPRFPPVREDELSSISAQISVLSPPAPMQFSSEEDLLAQIRPGVDGLILECAGYKGTFLPSMWEQLPRTIDFWQHLKLKAGLPVQFWHEALTVSRYETECFAEPSYFVGPLG